VIRIQKILYPTDFSSWSNQAYFHAVSLAEKHGAVLTVVFVFNPESTPSAGHRAEAEHDRQYWRDLLEQIRPLDPNIVVNHVFLEGDPATQIVRYARESASDMIVMGTHGRTGMERLLLGSVAEKVLRDATCTVMVVKLPRGGQSAERGASAP
jgi:nucleotide-binding universal stress UspA family protein